MITVGTLVTLMGTGTLAHGAVAAWPREDEVSLWAMSRGGVVTALGTSLFLLSTHLVAGPVPVLVLTALLLSALMVARFHEHRGLNGPRELPPRPALRAASRATWRRLDEALVEREERR